jgi:hypothetical protein
MEEEMYGDEEIVATDTEICEGEEEAEECAAKGSGKRKRSVGGSVKQIAGRVTDEDEDFCEDYEDFDDAEASEDLADDGAYVCVFDGCGKSFNREGKLADHMRTHTGEVLLAPPPPIPQSLARAKADVRCGWGGTQRPYVCSVDGCDKRFTRSHHLKRHELSHTGAKPHRCDHPGCDAAFLTAQHLRRHQLQHVKEKPYACSEPGCDARFVKHGQLQRHLCTEHDHAYPYPCTEPGCGKGFLHPSQLRRHTDGVHKGACRVVLCRCLRW